jgi:hypothetical protein
MPNIRLIIEDDAGHQTEQTFALSGDLESLDSIDEAVEQFKNAALPQIEQQLLAKAQAGALEREKKTAPQAQRL